MIKELLKKILSKRDVKSASIGSISIKFGAAFFAFLNGLLLAQYLTLEGFGYYVLVISTITLLAIPVTAGIPFLITRYISKYNVSNNMSAVKGLLIKTNRFSMFMIIGVYVLAAILYFIWWKNLDAVLVEALKFGFILLPLLGLSALRTAALRGLKYIVLADLPDTLVRNAISCVIISSFILFQIQLTPTKAIIIQIVATSIGFVLGYYFLFKKLWHRIQKVTPTFHTKEWFRQTIPFSVNSGVQIIKTRVLTYLLVIFGSIDAVAIYEIAVRGASLVSFVLDALNNAIAPFVSSSYERQDMKALQNIITKTGRIIFVCSIPVALVFILGGERLLIFVFGEAYGASYWPLFILCIGQIVSSIIGCVGLLLNMTGYQRILSRNNFLFLVVNVIISIPLITYYGAVGAAIVSSFILILQNITLLYYVRKLLNVNPVIIR